MLGFVLLYPVETFKKAKEPKFCPLAGNWYPEVPEEEIDRVFICHCPDFVRVATVDNTIRGMRHIAVNTECENRHWRCFRSSPRISELVDIFWICTSRSPICAIGIVGEVDRTEMSTALMLSTPTPPPSFQLFLNARSVLRRPITIRHDLLHNFVIQPLPVLPAPCEPEHNRNKPYQCVDR
jgi:hypothetical protein